MLKLSRLYPMCFPEQKHCITCQHLEFACAVRILPQKFTNRQLYYCPTCATEKSLPPAAHLLSRIKRLQTEQTQATLLQASGSTTQLQQKAKARSNEAQK